jgi:hypothetical protein
VHPRLACHLGVSCGFRPKTCQGSQVCKTNLGLPRARRLTLSLPATGWARCGRALLKNPFLMPPDEEVFRMREEEKRRKRDERELMKVCATPCQGKGRLRAEAAGVDTRPEHLLQGLSFGGAAALGARVHCRRVCCCCPYGRGGAEDGRRRVLTGAARARERHLRQPHGHHPPA